MSTDKQATMKSSMIAFLVMGLMVAAVLPMPVESAGFHIFNSLNPGTGFGNVTDAPDGEPADGASVIMYAYARSTDQGQTGTTDIVGTGGTSGTANSFQVDTTNLALPFTVGDMFIFMISKDTGSGGYAISSRENIDNNAVQYVSQCQLQKIGGTYGSGTAGTNYLEAWRVSQTSTFLNWPALSDPSGNVYGYRIYRSDGGPLTHLAYVTSANTEYTDNTCVAGQSYDYTISVMFRGQVSGVLSFDNSVESEFDSFSVTSPPDVALPTILTTTTPSNPSTAGDTLNVTATVADDTDVSNVYIDFTTPTGSQNISMTDFNAVTQTYGPATLTKNAEYTYIINEQTMGWYTWHIAAVDSSDNWNGTAPVSFYLNHSAPDYVSINDTVDPILAGQTSSIIVTVYDQYNNKANVTSDMLVWLNTTSPAGQFNTTATSTQIDYLTILTGDNSSTCDYYDEMTSTPTWTLTAENLTLTTTSNTTTIEVNPNVPFTVDIQPFTPIQIDADTAQATITAWVNDSFGNTVADGTTVTWSANGVGYSIPASTPTTGGVTSTTLTMGTTTGDEYNATATAGGVSNTTANITIIPGVFDHLVITTIGDQIAGTPFQVNVSVEDQNDNPTLFTGSVTLTGTANNAPDGTAPDYDSAYSFTNEQYHVYTVTLYDNQTGVAITADDGPGGIDPDTSNAFDVTSDVLDHIIVTPQTPTDLSADLGTYLITSTAYDQYNNTITGVPITMTSNDVLPANVGLFPAGVWSSEFPTSNPSTGNTNVNGEYSDSIFLSSVAGDSWNVTSTNGTITNWSATFTIVPGDVKTVTITTPVVPTSVSVDDNATGITMEAYAVDNWGNDAVGAIIDWSEVDISGNSGIPSFISPTSVCNSTGVASVTFYPGQSAGDVWQVEAKNESVTYGTLTNNTADITMTPGYVKTLILDTPTVATDVSADVHEIMVRVTAIDQWGNFVPNAEINWTFEDWDLPTNNNVGVPSFDLATNTTNASGECIVWFDTNTFAGDNWRINATNNSILWGNVQNSTPEITVIPGVGTTYQITPNPHTMVAGDQDTFTVTITDQWGNPRPAIQYTTIVLLTDSPTGVFYEVGTSNNAPFVTIDIGVTTDTIDYNDTTSGTWTITGIDTSSSPLLDNTTSVTVNAGPAADLVVDQMGGNTVPGNNLNLEATIEDAYGNTVTDYADTLHFDTDCPNSWIPADYTYVLGDAGAHVFDIRLNTSGTWYLNVSMNNAPSDYENHSWTVGGAPDHVVINPGTYWQATADDDQTFTAILYDSGNNVLSGNFTWETNDTTGTLFGGYYNPVTPGNYTIWANETDSGIDTVIIVNISAGALDHITLSVTAGTTTFTANGYVNFSAAGFDQYDNSVATAPSWGTTGTGTLTTWTDIANYTDTLVGTYEIWADDGGVNTSIMVSVTAGALDHIDIDPLTPTITADEIQSFTALGYDIYNNLVPINPVWTTDGGSINATTGVYTPSLIGTYNIWATDGLAGTTTIDVTVGVLDHIKITEFGGAEILGDSLTTNVPYTYYAKGYDANDNYISNVSVTWNATGSLDPIAPGPTDSVVFTPTTDVTTGQISADDGSGHTDLTGTLTVSSWTVDWVTIEDAAAAGSLIPDTILTTDNTSTVYAIGYNNTYGAIGPVSVTWGVTWDLDAIPAGPSSSVTFDPATAGTSGNITIDDGSGHTNETGNITVNIGLVDYVEITGTFTITAGGNTNLTATAYDADGNTVTTPISWWTGNGVIDTWGNYTHTVVGTWTVWANDTGPSGEKDSVTITVIADILDSIVITPAPGNMVAGTNFDFDAQGYDQYSNTVPFTGGFTWETDVGAIDVNGIYSHTIVGTYNIWANDTGINGTATVIVSEDILDTIVVAGSNTIIAGEYTNLSAAGFDQYGNNVTFAVLTWETNNGTIDTWGNYSNIYAGTWVVWSNDSGESTMFLVTVNAGSIDHIDVTPGSPSITADDFQLFTALGYDAYNNPVPISPTWATDGGAIASGVYVPNLIGDYTVWANDTVSGSATINVTVGVLDQIMISGTTGIIAGGNTNLTTTGYDVNGNLASTSVTWEAPNGTVDVWGNYTHNIEGTWTVWANDSGVSSTIQITITADILDSITLAPGTPTITADQQQAFVATGYDQYGNVVGLSSTTWWAEAGSISGIGVYSPMQVGTWDIMANDTGISGNTTITVTAGALAYIQIQSVAGDGGALIPDQNMNSIASQDMYIEGYDSNGNWLGPVSVTWDVTGDLNDTSLPGGSTTTFTFTPFTDGTSGRIVANDGADHVAATGVLTITQWIVDYVAVETSATITSPVGATTLTTDDSLTLFAIAYNTTGGGRLGPVSADWIETGTLDNILFTGSSFFFDPMTSLTAGTIKITYGGTIENETGTIIVVLGDLSYITISNTTSETTTDADHVVNFTAEGYDLDGNINGSVSFTWEAENGTIAVGVFTPWSVGTWTVWANATNSTGVTKTGTYTITVTPGMLDYILVTPSLPSITADDVQLFSAVGYDQYDNIAPTTITWDVNGSAINPSGIFTPGMVGTYMIWANDTGISGTTNITVTPGVLDEIVISGTLSMTAGDYTNLSAAGFDHNGNSVALVVLTWETENGTIDIWGNYSSDYIGTWNVWANDTGISAMISITVTAGPVFDITISPPAPGILADNVMQFSATAKDLYGNPTVFSNLQWATSGGSIDQAGLYTPGPPGTWFIWATDTIEGASSFTVINVAPGPITLIQVNPVYSVLTPGATQDYDAIAYDVRGNIVDSTDINFAWESTGGLVDVNGTYTAGAVAGTYTIWANHSGQTGMTNTTIVIGGGGGWIPDSITIGDASGTPIGATSLTTDDTITLYAWGYNATKLANEGNGTIGPLDVDWDRTGTLQTLAIMGESSIIFDPTTQGVGTIRASHIDSGESDETGTITITLGALDHIIITGSSTVTADDNTTYNATGYDADDNMIPGLNFTWTTTDGSIAWWDIDSANFTPMNTGVITLDAGIGTVNGTFDVTVTPGAVFTITPTITTLTIGAGNSTAMDATAYDMNGNVVPVTLTWNVPQGTRTVLGAYIAPTTVGNETIVVSFGGRNARINVTVVPNALDSIYLESGGTSSSLTLLLNDVVVFNATPKDMYGNNRTDEIEFTTDVGDIGRYTGIYTASTISVPDSGIIIAKNGSVESQISVTIGVGPITRIEVTPADPTLEAGMVHIFSAVAFDAADNIVNTVFTWRNSTGGNIGFINSDGILDAANTAGSGRIEASAGGIIGISNVTIVVSPSALDSDGDGIPDINDPDADGDGIPDTWAASNEIADPDADSDGDGLSNIDEYYLGTDPTETDTDGDGTPDGEDPQPLSPLPTGDDGGTPPALFFAVLALAALATVELLIIIFKKKK